MSALTRPRLRVDPFLAADPQYRQAERTCDRRGEAFELRREQTAAIRMIRSALIGGFVGWALVIAFILLVTP